MAYGDTTIVGGGVIDGGVFSYVNPTLYMGQPLYPVTTLVMGNGDTAATPAAKTVRFTNGSGVDNAAGALTIIAPRSTGAATPADLIFQTGVVAVCSAAPDAPTTPV